MNHPNQGSAPPLNQSNYNAAPSAMAVIPNRKAVNIIAMGSSRQDFFTAQLMETRPDILQNAEIWTINYMGAQIRCDRIVHVDPVHAYLGHPPVRDMCEFSLKDNIPLYTSHPHPKYPNQVIYPFDRVSAALGGITYFNTSVAYAIALAMADGFNEIGLFGCDFSYPDVHMAESGRANCEFLMGIGTQRGIRFAVAQSSTLMDMYCRQQPYGWFADPNLPPNNGGRLMTAGEVFQHVHAHRNPRKLMEYVYPIQTTAPVAAQPLVAQSGQTTGYITYGGTAGVPASAAGGGGAGSGYVIGSGGAGGAVSQVFTIGGTGSPEGTVLIPGITVVGQGGPLTNGHDTSALASKPKRVRARKQKPDQSSHP